MFLQAQTRKVDALRPAGFRLGLKQRSISLRPELLIPDQPDFNKLDDELLERFGIEPQAINSRITRPLSDGEQSAQRFAWQMMSLACELLQSIRIPCFDRGVIIDIQPASNDHRRYYLSCLFPSVEGHPEKWIMECIGRAYRLLFRLADPARTETDIADQLEALHEKFIVAAKKQIPGGDSTIPVLKTAFHQNIPFLHLGRGIYQLGWGAKRRFSDRSTSEWDSAVGATISRDKSITAHLLRQAGLPAPVHESARTRDEAAEAAQRIGFPVVVKPADLERGEGVTVNIHDAEAASSAFDSASTLSKHILVEKQVSGLCHRILVAGAHSPYTVGRLPLAVVGDGIHTVRELITQANQAEARLAKHRRQKLFPSDELAEQTLRNRGLNFESIPDRGMHARLRPIETTEWGGLPKVFSEEVHPENVRVAVLAAKLMNLNVAGVDMISEDISRPWYENGAVINEVNFAPYLGLRYEYQRAGVDYLVHSLFTEGARIPVEIFIGDEAAWTAAHARLNTLAASRQRVVCSSHMRTVGIEREIRLQPDRSGLYGRCQALLMDPATEALLLVVQTDELLFEGLPVDSIDALTLVNKTLASMNDLTLPAVSNSADKLLASFRPYLKAA